MYGQTLVDTASGGYFGDKTAEEVYDIYEMLATNSQQKAVRGRRAGMHEVNTSTSPELASMVDELSRKMNLLLKKNALVNEKCAFCGVLGHDEMNCGMARGAGVGCDEVNYVGGIPKCLT